MQRPLRWLAVLLAGLVLLAGCASLPFGNPRRGEELFHRTTLGDGAPGCVTCHSLEPGEVIVGPSLAGIGTRAAERIRDPNYTGNARSPEMYLMESIVHPDVYVVEGFPAGVMYQEYARVLYMRQIHDLVAYLMTLR